METRGGASPLSRLDKGFGGTVKENYFLDDALTSGSAIVSKTIFLRRKGFTLAEVLITLAIIGVVAALTIPTLVQNYQTRAWDTSAKVFERKLEEATRVMNTQQTLAGYTRTKDFVEELSKHIKITKICDSDELSNCFAEKATWEIFNIDYASEQEDLKLSELKTALDLGQADWDTEAIGVQFANGTTGLLAYNPECTQNPYSNQITGTSCLAMIYDTSGYKSPNTTGKDIRGINSLINKCAFKMGSVCASTPMKYSPLTPSECKSLKNDLGISECPTGIDYWGGAVKACGGINNMPTGEQLAKMASYVSNTNISTEVSVGELNIKFDEDKASKLGWTTDNMFSHIEGVHYFQIWGKDEETDGDHSSPSYIRSNAFIYYASGSYAEIGYSPIYRRNDGLNAVCIY